MSHNAPQSTAEQIMTRRLVTLSPETMLEQATRTLLENQVSNAPVVNNDNNRRILVGFISERDCLEYLANEIFFANPDQTVATVMKRHPVCVSPHTDVFTLASIFTQHNYRQLPVVAEDNELVGIVSRRDVLQALEQHNNAAVADKNATKNRPDLAKLVNHRFIIR
ncbi:CBS domain-containing protein [Acanthopleuribacter pedis]|uniref:CBS domain-containing protein n=1 Tax=Acanthopleuribacter pedis TaxID=442870 RepID=A0A8J7QTU0_9BACT|nr:CBS domain-containing protein [Acanthopleuribacter pedis]MBO1323273.1 CBS domain-containing protein [Acanthopleuribacter pedis]